jgi:hypothetical protein
LLIAMALENAGFNGVGLDASLAMCQLARKRTRLAGLGSRIRIHQCDGRDVASVLSGQVRRGIDSLHGASFLNEFFGAGDSKAVAVLRQLRQRFPGRTALFADYYGELGKPQRPLADSRLALLQDVAQVASRQGVPPTDVSGWLRVYEQAGCTLKRAVDFENDGIRTFIHHVQF